MKTSSITVRGLVDVVIVETIKLSAQLKTRLLVVACIVAPFLFAAALTLQSTLPEDTLFGRAAKDSGFSLSLVILSFGALWPFAVLTSVVAGDLFAAEDRYGTWATLLTRTRSRAELFWGKVATAFGASTLAVLTLGLSSLAAGTWIIGTQPLVDLTGMERLPADAATIVTSAWIAVLPGALAFTSVAVLLSIVTRNSAAGIGVPIVLGLLMQLYAFVDGPELVRRLLLTTTFGDWHGLVALPAFTRPLWHGLAVSSGHIVLCLAGSYRLMARRDIGN